MVSTPTEGKHLLTANYVNLRRFNSHASQILVVPTSAGKQLLIRWDDALFRDFKAASSWSWSWGTFHDSAIGYWTHHCSISSAVKWDPNDCLCCQKFFQPVHLVYQWISMRCNPWGLVVPRTASTCSIKLLCIKDLDAVFAVFYNHERAQKFELQSRMGRRIISENNA